MDLITYPEQALEGDQRERRRELLFQQACSRINDWMDSADSIELLKSSVIPPVMVTAVGSVEPVVSTKNLNPQIFIDAEHRHLLKATTSRTVILREIYELAAREGYYFESSYLTRELGLDEGSLRDVRKALDLYGCTFTHVCFAKHRRAHAIATKTQWVWESVSGGMVTVRRDSLIGWLRSKVLYLLDLFRTNVPISKEFIMNLLQINRSRLKGVLVRLRDSGIDFSREKMHGEIYYVYDGLAAIVNVG